MIQGRPLAALTTGTHSNIAAIDQIRPIATTMPTPMPTMCTCISLRRV